MNIEWDQDDKVRVVQTLLFVEGINTLLQTLFGTRLPTVIGGSYAFMVPVISIIHDSSLMGIADPHQVSLFLKSVSVLPSFLFSSFFSCICFFSLKFDLHSPKDSSFGPNLGGPLTELLLLNNIRKRTKRREIPLVSNN